MTRRSYVAAVVGAGALALAVLTATGGVVPTVLTTLANDLLVTVVGAAVGLVGLVILVTGDESTHAVETGPGVPASDASGSDSARVGKYVDLSIERPDIDESARYHGYRSSVRGMVREKTRTRAISVVADAEATSVERAETSVVDGTWTDDPRAAAFLGRMDVRLPLRYRIEDWAYGERYKRGLEATVAEIERLASREEGER